MEDFNNTSLNNNNDELDAMRLQLAELKSRIDRNSEINEKHMMSAIKRKMRGVHRSIYRVIIMGLVAIPLWGLIGYVWNLPWYFTAFTIVMLSSSMIADYIINHVDVDHMTDNMTDTARKLVKMKKYRLRQEFIAFPVLTGWLAWFIWELHRTGLDKDLVLGMSTGAVIGAVIGACIGLRIFFNLQKANDEMLEQIKELED